MDGQYNHGGVLPNHVYNMLFMDGHVKMHYLPSETDLWDVWNDVNEPDKEAYWDPTPGDGTLTH